MGGIIVGIIVSLIFVVVVAIVIGCRRRRRKRCPTSGRQQQQQQQPHCPTSRSSTSVSTISAGNGTTVQHVPSADGIVRSPMRRSSSMRHCRGGGAAGDSNAGFADRNSWSAHPADEPPPPYDGVIRSPAAPLNQFQGGIAGATTAAAAPPTVSSSSTAGFLRDMRQVGRSLPPTPIRPQALPRRLRDSCSEHIYDEPTTLFAGNCAPSPAMPVPPTHSAAMMSFPRTSTTSRIRLGTTALRPGSSSSRCHSPQVSGTAARGVRSTGMYPIVCSPTDAQNVTPVFDSSSSSTSPLCISSTDTTPFCISNNFSNGGGAYPVMSPTVANSELVPLRYGESLPPSGAVIAAGYCNPGLSPLSPQSTWLPHVTGAYPQSHGESPGMGVNDQYDQPWESIMERMPHAIQMTSLTAGGLADFNARNATLRGHGASKTDSIGRHTLSRRNRPGACDGLAAERDPFDPSCGDQYNGYPVMTGSRTGRNGYGGRSDDRGTASSSRAGDDVVDGGGWRNPTTRYGSVRENVFSGTRDTGDWRRTRDRTVGREERYRDVDDGGNGGGDPHVNHFHPRSGSTDSCGNSSSTPLVLDGGYTERRQRHGSRDFMDFLSPTRV